MAKTYGTVTTFTAGSVLTAAQMNVAGGAVNNLVVPAAAKVLLTSNITSYVSGTDISWQTNNTGAAYDTDGMWSAGSPTRLTIQTPGIYLIVANIYASYTGTATQWGCSIARNGGGISYQFTRGSSVSDLFVSATAIASCSAADYLTVYAQLTGSTANIIQANVTTYFSATWIGRTS